MNYKTPADSARYEQTIKKSRFIAVSQRTPDRSQLKQFLDSLAMEFPDARHICYAAVLGPPETGQQLYSDDGEPSGTAGKPILNVLQYSNTGDIATAVVRYFGGIKLGAGGLVRAYSGSASGSVVQLTTQVIEQTTRLQIQADFPFENTIRHLLDEFCIDILDVRYEHNLQINCLVPVTALPTLRDRLTDATRGKIAIAVHE